MKYKSWGKQTFPILIYIKNKIIPKINPYTPQFSGGISLLISFTDLKAL
jgi:hypothetical protein